MEYVDGLSVIIQNPDPLYSYFGGRVYLHKWITKAPSDYSDLREYNSSGNYNLICCESHYSQAKSFGILLF